ncbi:YqiA/YcfP family alpha/beta fold hydrolase [Entomomonas asaccharolytica]|uniref:Esterase n=1 Tax=Entomomonas asaccharolytica TaxID=2785331 RepID=A0A974NIL4_9GAMM|nr:YqiA/YcfP family alpha/beta fold hydrolase [Entomomonas asaccharolytica]QQP87077.1 esterase [Entomomonas asaccharolytica]
MKSLIYIHGFNSSAKGFKCQQIKDLMLERGQISHFRAPNLSLSPLEAIDQLKEIILSLEKPTLIGSSLGGYYATYLAERYQLKALLINPAVLPHKFFGKNFDEQESLQDNQLLATEEIGKVLKDVFDSEQKFIESYVKELATLETPMPTEKERFKVWLKAGDDVLDHRFAKEWYKNCDLTIDAGGDHSFSDFAERVPEILEWAEIPNN